MAKVFKLGDFFGITATQLVLFQPAGFSRLLSCKYTAHVNERLYSLIKEIECLKKVLEIDTVRPDYEGMSEDFKMLGYLGLSESSTKAKTMGAMASFYKDSQSMSVEDLTAKYGSDTQDILDIMSENTKIDVTLTFPSLGSGGASHKIVNILFKNIKNIDSYYRECKNVYQNGQVGERMIMGKSIREIIDLDMENADSDTKCCYFVNNLCGRLRSWENEYDLNDAVDELVNNITSIMNEYDEHDIIYSTADEIREILQSVYSDMTIDKLNELLGEDLTLQQYEDIFEQLDACLIGGMGFNSESMGDRILESISHDDTKSWSVVSHEHNKKLDKLLRIAYIDAMSRKYMRTINS